MSELIKGGYSICFNSWLFDHRIQDDLRLLLYISSLCAENGYCYAKNAHFCEKFAIKNEETVSRKIKRLENMGLIKIEYEKRGFEIINRRIFLIDSPLISKSIDHGFQSQSTIDFKVNRPLISKSIINNTIDNNTIDNIITEREEKEDGKKLNEITCLEELLESVNKKKLQDEFFYKIGDEESFLRTITEFWMNSEEKGKVLTIKTAETRFKYWLKPKYETDEDREEMKKVFLRKQKKNNPIIDDEEEKRKEDEILRIEAEDRLISQIEQEMTEIEKLDEMMRAEKELLEITKGRGKDLGNWNILIRGKYRKNLLAKAKVV